MPGGLGVSILSPRAFPRKRRSSHVSIEKSVLLFGVSDSNRQFPNRVRDYEHVLYRLTCSTGRFASSCSCDGIIPGNADTAKTHVPSPFGGEGEVEGAVEYDLTLADKRHRRKAYVQRNKCGVPQSARPFRNPTSLHTSGTARDGPRRPRHGSQCPGTHAC